MIFVDTSFWIAFAIPSDAHHVEATALLARHDNVSLTTSNLIVGETWTFVRRCFGHDTALRLVDLIERAARLRTVRVESAAEDEAWRWLRARPEREYSFVDATSFALMRRLRIREALAFDDDFAAAGFVELRA